MPGPSLPLDFQEATGAEPSLWEQFGAAMSDAGIKNSNSRQMAIDSVVDAEWEKIAGVSAARRQQLGQLLQQAPKGTVLQDIGLVGDNNNPASRETRYLKIWALQELRNSLPELERGSIPTPDQFIERGKEQSLAQYYDAQDVISRASPSFINSTAQFAGGAVGAMQDPINVASMLALKYPATSVLRTIGIETAGGAVTQALIEPATYDYMNDLGIDYSLEDSVNSILQAGVGAGVLSGAVRGLEKGVVRLQGGIPIDELRARYRRQGIDPDLADLVASVDRRAAASIVRDVENVERENPFAGVDQPGPASAEAATRHQVETMRADETVQHGRPVTPAPEGDAPPIAGDRTPEGVELVDLSTLKRDAYLFQYKDADIDGVTPALQGVDTWAPERAGLVIGWERADGERFIVDGHQRHALAGRLTAAGHPPIQAPVFMLREADGVSAAQARTKAAIKNIGEGSGSALDAAYILRSSEPGDLRGLPPNSALVKSAAGLANLSDDAWGMVINDVADERWGGLIGRLVEDRDLHAQILKAVQRMEPASPAVAENMIRDMMAAPRVESQTMDLFGASTTTELLIAERARVKAAAMAALGKSRTAFKVALSRQADLEAQGNVLAAKRNREALDADTAAALRLEKDAHLKGWVSDALSQAAKDLRDGSSLTEVTGRLVEAVRRGEAAGAQGRAGDGGAGRGPEGAGGAGSTGGAGAGQARRSPETLTVDLKRSTWRKAQDGADTVAVLVNPSDAALRKLSKLPKGEGVDGATTVSLRYLRDPDNNLYVWRGDLAIHEEIADELKLQLQPDTAGKASVEDGKVLWNGVPDRPGAPVSKRALIDGGPIAWRRELTRLEATADDIERVLSWLDGQRKDVIEEVRASFSEDALPAGTTKADMMTDLREQVRAHHAREAAGGDLPLQMFADDADVTRMRDAEDALRQPVMDEGARLGAEIDAEKMTDEARQAGEASMLDMFERDLREARKLEEADPGARIATFVDPETGEPRAVSALLDEIDRDKQRTQVLELCAYPGGKGKG